MKRMRNRQGGVSIVGIMVIVGLFAFFLTVVMRLLPSFMDSRELKSSLESVTSSSNSSMSLVDVKRKLNSHFMTNRIEVIDLKDVKIYRDKGKIVIDANYETRTELFEGVDAVLMFDKFTYIIQ
jgi:hypothetical protein